MFIVHSDKYIIIAGNKIIMSTDQSDKERLIRLEERVLSLQTEVGKLNESISNINSSIRTNELLVSNNSLTISKGERLFWIVISGVVGLVIWLLQHSVGK